jgi:hypothetical protein
MNIFFLHKFPSKSAEYLCDKHIPKMLLESCQMLSTAVQENAGERLEDLYKPAYPKHPMTKWVGSTFSNFQWTLENAVFISQEYCKRFKKLHKSSRILNVIYDNQYYKEIPDERFTNPPQCMPDQYRLRSDLYVKAYRKYYKGEKEYFAKWEKGRQQPEWW